MVISTEPGRQVRLAAVWLAATLAGLILLGLLFDVGVIFALPLLLLMSGTAAIGLLIRGALVARDLQRNRGRAALAVFAAPLAIVTVAALTLPVGRFGGYAQAEAMLVLKRDRYERIMAMQHPSSDALRTEWASVAGAAPDRLWSFGYGGFLSIDRDIIYDPFDRPEPRAVRLLGATAANCRWLRSHFYDCTLDF